MYVILPEGVPASRRGERQRRIFLWKPASRERQKTNPYGSHARKPRDSGEYILVQGSGREKTRLFWPGFGGSAWDLFVFWVWFLFVFDLLGWVFLSSVCCVSIGIVGFPLFFPLLSFRPSQQTSGGIPFV